MGGALSLKHNSTFFLIITLDLVVLKVEPRALHVLDWTPEYILESLLFILVIGFNPLFCQKVEVGVCVCNWKF